MTENAAIYGRLHGNGFRPSSKGNVLAMAKEHQNDIQVLMKHISSTSMQ